MLDGARGALEKAYDVESADVDDTVDPAATEHVEDTTDGVDTETDQEETPGDTETATDKDPKKEDEQAVGEQADSDDQTAVDKKIGKLTARAKSAEEQLESSQGKVNELLAKQDDIILSGPVSFQIHPDFVADDERTVIENYDILMDDQALFTQIIDSGEAYKASGRGRDTVDYEVEDAERELRKVNNRLSADGGEAKQLIKKLRKQQLEDAREGRKLRLSENGIKKTVNAKKKKTTPIPPHVGGEGGNSRKNPLGSTQRSSSSINARELLKTGVSRSSLAEAYEKTI